MHNKNIDNNALAYWITHKVQSKFYPGGNCTVSLIRKKTEQILGPQQMRSSFNWSKDASGKVNCFIWRAKQDKISSVVALLSKWIVVNSSYCSACIRGRRMQTIFWCSVRLPQWLERNCSNDAEYNIHHITRSMNYWISWSHGVVVWKNVIGSSQYAMDYYGMYGNTVTIVYSKQCLSILQPGWSLSNRCCISGSNFPFR